MVKFLYSTVFASDSVGLEDSTAPYTDLENSAVLHRCATILAHVRPSLRKLSGPENAEKGLYFRIVAQESHSCATFYEKIFTMDEIDGHDAEELGMAN